MSNLRSLFGISEGGHGISQHHSTCGRGRDTSRSVLDRDSSNRDFGDARSLPDWLGALTGKRKGSSSPLRHHRGIRCPQGDGLTAEGRPPLGELLPPSHVGRRTPRPPSRKPVSIKLICGQPPIARSSNSTGSTCAQLSTTPFGRCPVKEDP